MTEDQVTQTLLGLERGAIEREDAAEVLAPLVYDQLRGLARAYLAGEPRGHTLQPTALVHEAFVRLAHQDRVRWRGKAHFFAVAAKAMRRVLVDHARRRKSLKRGRGWHRITLSDAIRGGEVPLEDLLSLDQALSRLAALDPRQAEVVELRFFAGLPVADVAAVLGLSKRTVEGEWTHARVWLQRELGGGDRDSGSLTP